jgi:hypothetical protein
VNRFPVLLGLSFVLSLGFVSVAHAETDDSPSTGDFALKVLDHVERWNGQGTPSPLELKLRAKLEKMGNEEAGTDVDIVDAPLLAAGGDAGGFEPPPDTKAENQPADDDAQFGNLKDLMQKMSPLERIKAAVWFMVIRPKTAHRDELIAMIDQQSASLSAQEKADLQDYMATRRSLAGASTSNRISTWQTFQKVKAKSVFADTAGREAQYLQSLEKERKGEKHKGTGHFLVKVGVVAIVLALIAVIVFGAAK